LQRGGTLIAEWARDPETHRRSLRSADDYRPDACPTCRHPRMHRHDYAERVGFGGTDVDPTVVLRFICARAECAALWRVLPAFLARHLWFVWPAIRDAVTAAPPAPSPPPPPPPSLSPPPSSPPPAPPREPSPRSVARWRERLAASARVLVQLFASLAQPAFTAMIASLSHGIDATRAEFVAAYGDALHLPAVERLAALAGHIHRAAPGLRLM
jgi:hypothetical protein